MREMNNESKQPDSMAIHLDDGKVIEYRLIQSTRARRMRIAVSEKGVNVTVPRGLSRREAENFLQQNSVWVINQLERIRTHSRAASPLPRDVILLHGLATRVKFIEEPGRLTRIKVEQDKGGILLRVPNGTPHNPLLVMEPWLREEARRVIEQVVKQQMVRMQLKPKGITIRDQKTRWGSCSSRGTLSFNWRIIMAPGHILEYVVIHELAHLKYPNHSSLFWSYVAQFYPEYKAARLWFRKNASMLRTPAN